MSRFRLSGVFSVRFSCLLLLTGCSVLQPNTQVRSSTSGAAVAVAHTLVVGDEPFAVRAGSAILAQGGNAADAATAMFFALSVTYPVAAGAGGGGICLVRGASGAVTELDFLPRAASGGGAYAVPDAVRGFYDLQKRFGALPWQRDISPAQALADAGFPISQALSARLAGLESIIRSDAALSTEFLDETGALKKPGTVVSNQAYARTLSTIRESGADGFVQTIGGRLIATPGGGLSADDFIRATTRQVAAARRTMGQVVLSYPAPGTGAGTFTAALLARTGAASPASAGSVSLAATQAALVTLGAGNVPADLGSTGFAVLDGVGGIVSCAVTMNGPFGSGRTIADTGIQLASAPSGTAGLASAFLMPLIAGSNNGMRFAGAAAGGPNGAAAIAYAVLRAVGGARLASAADIRTTGAAPRDTINLIACQTVCVPLPDPGGHGLGASGDTVPDGPAP